MELKLFPRLMLRCPALSFSAYIEDGPGKVCTTPFFKAAILLASRALYNELSKKGFREEEMDKKLRLTLQKYVNRSCYRPTPFGMFSSFSLLHWSDKAGSVIFTEEEPKVHLYPSRAVDRWIGQQLQEKIRDTARITLNGSGYKVGGTYRYYRSSAEEGTLRFTFALESIEATPIIRAIAALCRRPAFYPAVLIKISALANCSGPEAAEFIDRLLERQFLVSETDIGITGQGYATHLISLCRQRGLKEETIRPAEQVLEGFSGQVPATNDHLATAFKPPVNGPAESLYYGAMERKVQHASLSERDGSAILKAFHCLDLLTPNDTRLASLEAFTQAFGRKFEKQAVPLLTALDPQQGVNYGNLAHHHHQDELLETVVFNPGNDSETAIPWSAAHQLLMKRWKEKSDDPAAPVIIQITDADLDQLKMERTGSPFPPSIPVLFRTANNQLLVEQAGGPSALTLCGRFTLFSNDVQSMALQLANLEQENNPGVIFAEIVHCCDDHADNINRRACIRKYEIPVLCQSERPAAEQIALSDLYISLVNDQLILYSATLHKRVIPRLSTAFNYTRNDLTLFRFLCDLQYQGIKTNFTLDLSSLFPGLEFYPRVEYAGTILHPASWHLPAELLKMDQPDDSDRVKIFSKLGLPRYFSLNEQDHQLVFDSEKASDLLLLADSVKPGSTCILKEFLFPRPDAVINRQGEPYIAQFLCCLYPDATVYQPVELKVGKMANKRKFIPGSSWLYLKIYCHPGYTNALLSGSLLRAIRGLPKNTTWFFVRYADPEHHIRLRIKLGEGETGRAMQAVQQQLERAAGIGHIDRLQADTYHRELERYGEARIGECEDLFYHSSVLIIGWLNYSRRTRHFQSTLLFALFTVARLLEAFFPGDLLEMLRFCREAAATFLAGYTNPKEISYRLDLRYRKNRQEISLVINDRKYLQRMRLCGKMYCLRISARQLLETTKAMRPAARETLLLDLLHMHMNRVFVHESRNFELATYHFLHKHFLSVSKQQASG